MANVELKKDFKDGQFLYGDDLNNNFKVIEAGVNSNLNELSNYIFAASEELKEDLMEITAQRGWDWENSNGERVTFYKGNTDQINNHIGPTGQLLYNTETGETYLSSNVGRILTGSGNILKVSEEEPTNPGTKVWIKPNELQKVDSTEVIDSLEGNETNLAPSVRAVKNALKQVYSTEEQVIGTWMGKPLYRKMFSGTTTNELSTFLTSEGNIKSIICTKGYIKYYDNTVVEIGKSTITIEEASRILVLDGKLRLDCGSSLYEKPFEVSVEYTKTTD